MNASLLRDVLEATRRTRSGRLTEATALLQDALKGHAGPSATPASGRREPPTIDAVAEPAGTDTVNGTARVTWPAGVEPAPLPQALRDFIGKATGGSRANAPRPPEGARFLSATYADAAGSRPYKLYVPASYRGAAVPLVVMLHGCTQSPDDFAAGTRMNEAAEERGFLVAYPQQTSAANNQKCWNWFSVADQGRDRGEPALIAGIAREVMAQYAVDPRRVYVAGLSAGGAAAAIMGSAYPDLFAAVGVHSGLACGAARDLPSAFAAMQGGAKAGKPARRPVPTIVFHGDRDATVHPSNADAVAAHAMPRAGLGRTTREGRVPGGHAYSVTAHAGADGRVALERWVVHGAGHAWSGGSPAGSHTDPQGPDATREMLRFFQGVALDPVKA